MDSETRKALEAAGVSYEIGLERFMGNEALYEKFLIKFLSDSSYPTFIESMKKGDMKQAERAVHTLKGTAGNLSIDPLFCSADVVVKAIRSKAPDDRIQELCKNLHKDYHAICDLLKGLKK
jgi:HPt (histidine-containing phosphotransfer) domain-containing protein